MCRYRKSDAGQTLLCDVLPELYNDLNNEDITTLKEDEVGCEFNTVPPNSPLQKLFLSKFSEEGVDDIRATVMSDLSVEHRKGLPSDNLEVEKYISHFDILSK